MSSVYVSALEYVTTDAGAEVTVTAKRIDDSWIYGGPKAKAKDLPPDVADALREWLEGAPTKAQP